MSRTIAGSQCIQGLRIVAQYLLLHRRTEAFEFIEFGDRIHLACRIGVSIVGADDQTVLAGIVDNMRDVVVGLAGDKHVVFTNLWKIFARLTNAIRPAD
jgi:hypothetical protein